MAKSNRHEGKLVGLGLFVLGVLFLLDNFTDWNIPWGGWWPVILIALGIRSLVAKGRSWVGGVVLIALGGLFLLDTQDVWDYGIGDIWRLWPVVLILIGGKIFFARRKKASRPASRRHFDDKSSPGELDITSVFGSNQRRITDQNLAGGQVVSVFGSTEIDLRDASLAGGEASLEITAVFGGVAIRIPHHWEVDQQITSIVGGVTDKRDESLSAGAQDRLTLTGSAVFGGIELKS